MSNIIHKIDTINNDERYGFMDSFCLLGAAMPFHGRQIADSASVPGMKAPRLIAGKLRLTLLAY